MDIRIENIFQTKRGNTCITVDTFKLSKCNVLMNSNIRFRCTNRSCNVTIIVNDKLNEIIENKNFLTIILL